MCMLYVVQLAPITNSLVYIMQLLCIQPLKESESSISPLGDFHLMQEIPWVNSHIVYPHL